MNNVTKIILGIVVAGIVVAVVIAISGSGNQSASSTPTPVATPAPQATGAAGSQSQTKHVITLKNGSFSPSTITIKSGETLTFENPDETIEISSDPHPTHTNNPELNSGTMSKGQGDSITLTKKGTWGYHNHLNPSEKGTVTVQ